LSYSPAGRLGFWGNFLEFPNNPMTSKTLRRIPITDVILANHKKEIIFCYVGIPLPSHGFYLCIVGFTNTS
jgi:hypothetical protein